ncbi:hypothetical protein NCCP2222_33570 [Sporosarcina sp. NCCP-2222]|uniref:tetratricopeptide repeat protein n=1 Tax=Sporosarcina sp. NCCP-2222 TaxID=2935073 RepID=UPI0020834BDB|nr:tetratricopeptide repeat protein [Sporosarcina sp. NCCP-2222]GKV57410.1 hypothetical protein NCCP2222_33570 [Sporosarcina sp. NCCP-2222]
MSLENSVRRNIVVSIILLATVCLIVANLLGKSQDKTFSQNASTYNEMVSALQENHFEITIEKSRLLEDSQKNTEMYHYVMGLATVSVGEYKKSMQHFQKVLEINPHNVEDSIFMLQYAEILIHADMKKEAQIVLEKCTELAAPESFPEYQERIAELQEQLAEQL